MGSLILGSIYKYFNSNNQSNQDASALYLEECENMRAMYGQWAQKCGVRKGGEYRAAASRTYNFWTLQEVRQRNSVFQLPAILSLMPGASH